MLRYIITKRQNGNTIVVISTYLKTLIMILLIIMYIILKLLINVNIILKNSHLI